MMDKVVNSIIEAEDSAKRMVEDAEKRAASILAEADEVIDQKNRQAAEQFKAYSGQQLQKSRQEADEATRLHIEKNARIIDEEIEGFKVNLEAAVKIIVEKI